ncbi:hypothetical protein PNEG_01340 [Pneumocystis murina B123]|uniref:Ribose-phosphate pyrophosphokinase 1 n=1 Tax=Pneumocystis murina (strain B123) TaxID=1069680 RepID=M7P9U0_PNEMU|nr:hypothetical protein PNEG_01340 [Pneumocystis murina B123]EMR10640.1 hypothetical protein PNEG_01340 [Pneumocystis murina B123]
MRRTKIFGGSSHPELVEAITHHLAISPAPVSLKKFSNQETRVEIACSVRMEDVFIIQSGSNTINDHLMELLIMISACKGASASKITAVMPYFPYSKQSKMRRHRGAITAKMVANLLTVAGVDHIITMDLHASQIQGFFTKPVDNLFAEPSIAKWITENISDWKNAVVVSKNPGGAKRVTSLADILNINFALIHTDRKRKTFKESYSHISTNSYSPVTSNTESIDDNNYIYNSQENSYDDQTPILSGSSTPNELLSQKKTQSNRITCSNIRTARLISGHVVDDDYPSSVSPYCENSIDATHGPDSMFLPPFSFYSNTASIIGDTSTAISFNDDESINLNEERMITLVGDVENKTALILDDIIETPGSFVAAAEHLIKNCGAKRVFVFATHGILQNDCLEKMEECRCIDKIVITNTYPVSKKKRQTSSKLIIIDISKVFGEAIRRVHNGESISHLFGRAL